MHIHTCTHTNTHIYTHTFIYPHAYTHMHTCTHTCTYIYSCTHTHTHTHICTHVYTHIHITYTRSFKCCLHISRYLGTQIQIPVTPLLQVGPLRGAGGKAGLQLAARILPTAGLWVESPPSGDQCGFGFVFFFIVSLTVCIVSIWEDLLSDFIRRVLRLRWLGTHLSCWALVKVASPSDVAGSPLEVVGSTPEPHRRCPGTGATPWGPAQHRPESSARFVPSSSHPEWTLPSMDLQPAWTRTPCRPHSVVTLSLMTSDLPQ